MLLCSLSPNDQKRNAILEPEAPELGRSIGFRAAVPFPLSQEGGVASSSFTTSWNFPAGVISICSTRCTSTAMAASKDW